MALALASASARADEATWKVLIDQAGKHQSVENFGQAEKFAREAVVEAERSFGENDARTADSLDALARILVFSGKPIEAEIQWRRVLRIRAAVLGPEARTLAITYLNIASALIRSNQITEAEAEAMFARAARIIEKTDGRDSGLYAAALFQLGAARVIVGQYAAAEEALKQALVIREKVDGPNSLEVSRTLNNLALAADAQGKQEEAKAWRQRSLDILQAAPMQMKK
ncbi:MAG: tetratricopeptide repeat protein [Burkholderiales bacterium]